MLDSRLRATKANQAQNPNPKPEISTNGQLKKINFVWANATQPIDPNSQPI